MKDGARPGCEVEMEDGVKAGYEAVAEPCRNFNILGMIVVQDPLDQREKLVLANCADQSTGSLIFVDPATGEGETIPFPGDAGAWALLYLEKHERLLVGTCEHFGYLLSLNLKTRSWAEPLRDEQECYIWNLALGSDGFVYGGTYPGCALLRYDPERHELHRVGRVSDNARNLYSRTVHGGVPGYILIEGGYDTDYLKAYHLESGTFRDFGIPGATVRHIADSYLCLEHHGSLHYCDARTFEPLEEPPQLPGTTEPSEASKASQSPDSPESAQMPPPSDVVYRMIPDGSRRRVVQLANGTWAGVRGQDYFIIDDVSGRFDLHRIPAEPPPNGIHTLVADDSGVLWGATTFGQTIFRYDPSDGMYWNSPVVCNQGGEVYGMAFAGGRLYMSAYAGGDHIVYDPEQPWDQLANRNPKTLRSVSPAFIRPTGRTVLGPDGGLYTGWSANYGVYGGALSRIDPATEQVEVWPHPVEGQQIAGVSANSVSVFFTTNGYASGLPYNEQVECVFAAWSMTGDIRSRHVFPRGVKLGCVLALESAVLVAADESIHIFDNGGREMIRSVECGHEVGAMVDLGGDEVALFGRRLTVLHLSSGRHRTVCELPGAVQTAAITPEGELYFGFETGLYKVKRDSLIEGKEDKRMEGA